MTEYVLLKDIALVVTADHYRKNISGLPELRTLRRVEYPVKISINDITVSNVTKSSLVKNNTIIVVPNNPEDALYIPFLLDSLYVKGVLLKGVASVRKLEGLDVVLINDEEKSGYCKLEAMLLSITKLGEARIGYEYFYTAERLLADLRDAMVFELFNNEAVHAENIYLSEFWKQEMNNLDNQQIKNNYDQLVALINSMLRPNNLLYDNLKRFYLFLERNSK